MAYLDAVSRARSTNHDSGTALIPAYALMGGVYLPDVLAAQLDEEQVPEREFDGLLLARSNQEPCVSGANRG